MTTTAPQVAPAPSDARQSPRSWVVALLAAALALVVGGLAGWALRGDSEAGAAVLAGGAEMTYRQEQIGDFLADYVQAWQDGDTDAIVAMFAPEGRYSALGTTYYVADGSLYDFAETNPFPELDVFEPWLVHGNEALSFHSVDMGTFADHVTLSADGEILIIDHTILTG